MPEITIYATPTCPYCIAAKKLLDKKNLNYTEIDVADDPQLRAQMTEKAGGANTVPQIWIGTRHIGGSDDLYALKTTGELDEIIEAARQG